MSCCRVIYPLLRDYYRLMDCELPLPAVWQLFRKPERSFSSKSSHYFPTSQGILFLASRPIEIFVTLPPSCISFTMGACLSSPPEHLLDAVDGDGAAYKQRYREDKVLGEGA